MKIINLTFSIELDRDIDLILKAFKKIQPISYKIQDMTIEEIKLLQNQQMPE